MGCNRNISDINQTFIIEPFASSGTTTACDGLLTNEVISCGGDARIYLSTGETIFNTSITPVIDGTIDFGLPVRRFRNINTINGTSTTWTSTIKIITPILDLGVDSSGNTRTITADNSVIAEDILVGGNY